MISSPEYDRWNSKGVLLNSTKRLAPSKGGPFFRHLIVEPGHQHLLLALRQTLAGGLAEVALNTHFASVPLNLKADHAYTVTLTTVLKPSVNFWTDNRVDRQIVTFIVKDQTTQHLIATVKATKVTSAKDFVDFLATHPELVSIASAPPR